MAGAGARHRLGTVLVALLAACQRPSNPQRHDPKDAAVPRLTLAQPRVTFESIVQDETAHHSLPLSNTGTAPLEIKAIEPSRFCRGTVDRTTLPPRSQGELEITCRSDLYGPLREQLSIRSNDPASEVTRLDLVGDVTPILAFDAQTVSLQMPFGQERSQDVSLRGTAASRANVELRGPSVADVEILPLATTGQAPRAFRIHCLGRKPGTNAGNLIVATHLERPREIAIPYSCKVFGTLDVAPTNPYFNLKISGPKSVFVTVRSTQSHFQVQAAHITEGPFGAEVEPPTEDGLFRIKVWVIDQQIDDETRGVTGTLLIVSNDRTEPRKQVPLFGVGRVNRASPLDPAP